MSDTMKTPYKDISESKENKADDYWSQYDSDLTMCGRGMVLPGHFYWKCLVVVFLSYALIPLMKDKEHLSAFWYAFGLIVLHVGILILYFWRVRCAEFGKGLWARLLGLTVCVALLMLVVQNDDSPDQASWAIYAWIGLLCVVHSFILALLMVELKPVEEEPLLNP